jgi:hypothetical protein
LAAEREHAFLFRNLATLRTDIPLFENVEELRWSGPAPEFEKFTERFENAVTAARAR